MVVLSSLFSPTTYFHPFKICGFSVFTYYYFICLNKAIYFGILLKNPLCILHRMMQEISPT